MTRILDKLLDSTKDFYHIDYEGGKMIITPLGYIYCAGNSVTDDPEQIYRWEEYSCVPFTLQQLWACNYDPEVDIDFINRRGDYITDLSRAQACEKLLDLMNEMEDEKHCVPYDMLEEGTPAGLYYDGESLLW